MRNLIDFLAKYCHWFLFVILEVISLVLLFRFNNYQGSVWFTSANCVSGKVLEAQSEVRSYFKLAALNEQLTQRNVYLEQQLRAVSEKLYDKEHPADTTVAKGLEIKGLRVVPAKVVDNTIDRADNFITIDKGSADGVRPDMGVVCGTGVVAIVYLVSEHYSVVIPVLNSKSNISCAIAGRGYFGYLHWSGGVSEVAFVDDIPRHAKFRLHDKIVTSGYSSVFPAGVLVGELLNVFNSTDGLSYRLQVKLSTDFSRLRDVCVIDDIHANEKALLLNAARDSIKMK